VGREQIEVSGGRAAPQAAGAGAVQERVELLARARGGAGGAGGRPLRVQGVGSGAEAACLVGLKVF